jgi:hypothetical protein
MDTLSSAMNPISRYLELAFPLSAVRRDLCLLGDGMKRGCSDTDVLTFRRIFEIAIAYCALKLLVTVCAQDIQGDLLQSLEVRCSKVSKQQLLGGRRRGKPALLRLVQPL